MCKRIAPLLAASLLVLSPCIAQDAADDFNSGGGENASNPLSKVKNMELIEIEVDYDDAIRPEQVEEAFANRPDISIVSVVHNDTPSGTINPVAEIGAIAEDHGALLLVDAVSSFGGMKVDAEGWHADIIVVGPQKCLAGPPGLSLMYVSDRAWEHMAANPDAPRGSILSILDWKDAHKPEVPFPFTPSVTEIFPLDSVLTQYLDEGPENVWRRHALTARATRRGIAAMASKWACETAVSRSSSPSKARPPPLRAYARAT